MATKRSVPDVLVTSRSDERAVDGLDAAMDVLADAYADLLIHRARADVAAELGIDERALDREHGRTAETARLAIHALTAQRRN